MKSFYRRLNSGWNRLLHVVLSGGAGLAFAFVSDGILRGAANADARLLIGLFFGAIIYQPLAWIALWVIDGFKSKDNTSEPVPDKAQSDTSSQEVINNSESLPDKAQSDVPTQEVVNTEENQRGMKTIAIKWIVPVLIFFVLYFPLYLVFVFNTKTQSLTIVCVFVSFILSRYLGKLIIRKYLKY